MSLSFNEVQHSSTVLVCDSSLSCALALNTSESSACFSGSLGFHTLMRGTTLRLGWGGMKTLKSPTSSLCCDAHSSPRMTLILDICFLKLRRYRMKSTWVAATPDWYVTRCLGFFLNHVLSITSLLANANSKILSPSVFLFPMACPPCTSSNPVNWDPMCPFQSPQTMSCSEAEQSQSIGELKTGDPREKTPNPFL